MSAKIVLIFCMLSLSPVRAVESVISGNPDWATEARGGVAGWVLHDCRRMDEGGRVFIRLPDPADSSFAKLSRRIALEDAGITAVRVTAKVRARPNGSGMKPPAEPAPTLRIYYHTAQTGWSFREVLWPIGREGAAQPIAYNEEWQNVSFELPRPADARQIEVAIEVPLSAFGLDVAELSVTAIQ